MTLGVRLALMWLGGFLIGFGVHGMSKTSYEKCTSMYETAEDIVECQWILENNK